MSTTTSTFSVTYRGYRLSRTSSGHIGIFTTGEPNPISTAVTWSEAEGIIDAWKDAP